MTRDDDVAALLREATEDIDVPMAPAEELARAGHRRIHRRRVLGAVAGVAAVAAIGVGTAVLVASLQPARSPASGPSSGGCDARVPDAVLPTWARDGFSDPPPRIAYVRGDKGDIVAILFAQPLTSPPPKDHSNKILWVARPNDPSSGQPDLRIDARHADGSATAVRTVPGGPGPSIIDLPKPGCWHLTLRWSGHTDSLDLAYAPG